MSESPICPRGHSPVPVTVPQHRARAPCPSTGCRGRRRGADGGQDELAEHDRRRPAQDHPAVGGGEQALDAAASPWLRRLWSW
ncbi:MAG: hypothetical protein ACRDPY_16535 [Streptosporangiaceae bacterium]